ncbi:putative vacuolar protein-sorting protein VPS45 [Cryptosporidium canis]|uniref:Vacuolar protein-sorting protein VPS45 n=1 Tax=Cryptosporidium canis TaxID=195482 RepID=A0A9D5DGV2_9CRYT|nr:putative vacuolar protein-sorting protein VPS45 [Cryptosporidium canis]
MMNLVKSSHELIDSIFYRITGIKVLILDRETVQQISLVYTQSELLKREVFLSELIDISNRSSHPHFSGIYFIRPNKENISILCDELKNPIFKEYYVYFTNNISPQMLQKIAISDENDLVKRIQEVRLDFSVPCSDLFSLNMNYFASLQLGEVPVIRYLANSPLCRNLAFAVERRLLDSHMIDIVSGEFVCSRPEIYEERSENSVLLIFDRREDPVTPLLTQWTYHAMIHDLLGISQNKVFIENKNGLKSDDEELVLSEQFDDFFKSHKYENFGDIGFSIRDMVNDHSESSKLNRRLETIEDINRFVQTYPDFKKEYNNIFKHVSILHEISRIVQDRDLMRISAIEQDLTVCDNIDEHSIQIGNLLSDSRVSQFDKLRLALLYSLKYEKAEIQINNFKHHLGSQANYIDKLIEVFGENFRSGDLFLNKTLMNIAKNTISKSSNNNIYIQHKTLLYYILENLAKGKLKNSRFPATSDDYNPSKKPLKVMVFVIGGITLEESRDINVIRNLYDIDIVAGGTNLLNSNLFLKDLELLINS